MTVYYNENEPYAAQWLRNLVEAEHIAQGVVDDRSILEVKPEDVVGHDQCHFFAGIAGWSRALQLAEVPEDFLIWTGSCPCQPFSQAGEKKGFDDDRHLWPAWFRLIRQCLPTVIFGEQVASPAGREWLDVVSADLEALGYAIGAADLCAAGVGAPHIRQRLYFVAVRLADDDEGGREEFGEVRVHDRGESGDHSSRCSSTGRVDHADVSGLQRGRSGTERKRETTPLSSEIDRVEHTNDGGGVFGTQTQGGLTRIEVGHLFDRAQLAGATHGFWEGADWLACRDERTRPVEPGTFPLADRFSSRVGRVRAYGNAIVPSLAATFIQAVMGIEWGEAA